MSRLCRADSVQVSLCLVTFGRAQLDSTIRTCYMRFGLAALYGIPVPMSPTILASVVINVISAITILSLVKVIPLCEYSTT